MASEKAIQNEGLVAASSVPETLCWRNNTGMGWQGRKLQVGVGQTVTVQPGMVILAEARPIRFGLVGSPDVLGCTAGRWWGHEYKSLTGAAREDQIKFQRAIERAGGEYRIIRTVEDARLHVESLRGKRNG